MYDQGWLDYDMLKTGYGIEPTMICLQEKLLHLLDRECYSGCMIDSTKALYTGTKRCSVGLHRTQIPKEEHPADA